MKGQLSANRCFPLLILHINSVDKLSSLSIRLVFRGQKQFHVYSFRLLYRQKMYPRTIRKLHTPCYSIHSPSMRMYNQNGPGHVQEASYYSFAEKINFL